MTFEQIRAALAAKAAPFQPERIQSLADLSAACTKIAPAAHALRQSIAIMSEERVNQDVLALRQALSAFDPALLAAQAALRELAKADILHSTPPPAGFRRCRNCRQSEGVAGACPAEGSRGIHLFEWVVPS